jgi:hypothetical protein
MKRLFAVLLLSLLAVQLCLLPIAAQGTLGTCPSAVTLPATDISVSSTTLNASVIIPPVDYGSLMSNRVVLASLQDAGVPDVRVFVSFQYGTAPSVYTGETPPVEISQSGNVQVSVSGLRPCATYYYCVKLHTIMPEPVLFDQYRNSLQGAGVGLDYTRLQRLFTEPYSCPDYYGNEVSFQTACPGIVGHGGNAGTGVTSSIPSNMSNIVVQSATVAATKVSPGEKVDITAAIANKGGSNGTSKVTLYINGQEAESKGISLSSGQSTTMNFSVSRNDPGTYTVLVNGVPAGSFTVDLLTNNDVLIYGVIALFTIGIIGVLYLVFKRRTA